MGVERLPFVEHRKSTGADYVFKGRYDCPRLPNDERLELNTPLPSTSSDTDALRTCCLEDSGVSGACQESDVNNKKLFQAASKPTWLGASAARHLLSRLPPSNTPTVRPYPYSHWSSCWCTVQSRILSLTDERLFLNPASVGPGTSKVWPKQFTERARAIEVGRDLRDYSLQVVWT